MSLTGLFAPLWSAFQGRQLKPTVILAVSTLTLITWKYGASPQYYLDHLSDQFVWFSDPVAAAAVYHFLGTLLLMGLVPVLVVKLVFRENLADYGVRLGNRKRTVLSFLIWGPIFALIAYISSGNPSLWQEYPINRHAGASTQVFLLHALTYLLFYVGWEFQFRGFMQHGLQESLGMTNALLVQVLASVLAHIGKPASETFAAILGGLLWGILAYRTRSLLSGFLQHSLLGILLDWFICHRS
jgi:uncharacterized protein